MGLLKSLRPQNVTMHWLIYSNSTDIENIIDLSIYKDEKTGSYTLSENSEYTKILSNLYFKLNQMTIDRINIDY